MKSFKVGLIVLICFLWGTCAKAQDSLKARTLDFESLLQEGFKNNYGLILQNLSYKKSVYNVMSTEGLISPYFNFGYTGGKGTDPTVSNDGTSLLKMDFVYPTKYGVNIYTGGQYENTKMLNPNYFLNASGGWVGIKMPLLRGLGKNSRVNAAIRATRLSEQASKKQLSNKILTYFRNILVTYLTLIKNAQQYKIRQDAMSDAIQYRKFILDLIANDNLPKAEKDKADELIIQQRQLETNGKINEMSSFYNTEKLTGVSEHIHIKRLPVIIDSIPSPDINHIRNFISKYTSVSDSLIKKTPLYRNVALLAQASKVQMDEAKNQLLNNLNLDIRVTRFGISKQHNFDAPFNSSYPGTSLLFTLDYTLPINNKQQRGSYLSSMAEYESNKTSLEQILFETHTEIQNSLSSLEQLINLYQQNKNLVSIRKQTYLDEKNKYKFGDSSQIDVILSFNNYYQSKIDLITSEFDLYNNIVQIDYLLGILPTNQNQLSRFSLDKYLLTY